MTNRDALAKLYLRIDHRTEVACSRILSALGVGNSEGARPPPGRIVAEISDQLGGDVAKSRLPESYPGTCALFYQGRSGLQCAIFPSYREAAVAARMAIDPAVGGYWDVVIDAGVKAPPQATFFVSAGDWLD